MVFELEKLMMELLGSKHAGYGYRKNLLRHSSLHAVAEYLKLSGQDIIWATGIAVWRLQNLGHITKQNATVLQYERRDSGLASASEPVAKPYLKR